MSKELLNTNQAKEWLAQFAPADLSGAELLLEDLHMVTNHGLIHGIAQTVSGFLESHDGPVALFASRENTGEYYFHPSKKDKRPQSVSGRKGVGSEGLIAQLCRDITTQHSDRLMNHPSILEMFNRKCRWLMVIDDMVGSGARAGKFINWLYRNKTIKSWISGKWIRFVIVAYSSTARGEIRLRRNTLVEGIYSNIASSSAGRLWSRKEREKIEKICDDYGQLTSRPSWPLGFESAFTNIVFAHKCPNTNPAILWAGKKNEWNGLFPSRPDLDLYDWPVRKVRKTQERVLRALGQTRLVRPSLFVKLNDESRQILTALACVASRRMKAPAISGVLGVSMEVARSYLKRCNHFGWIDDGGHITKTGLNLLESARRNDCLPEPQTLEVKEGFYFPKSFRGSVGSSSSGT